MAPIVLGIGGCSSSGKTTASRLILQRYRSTRESQLSQSSEPILLSLDDYYFHEDDPRLPPPQFGVYNWDSPAAFDWDRLTGDLKAAIADETKELVIVEGILIYEREDVHDLLDKKYFLTLSWDVWWQRRWKRTFDGQPDSNFYLNTFAWPGYVKSLQTAREIEDVVFLDSDHSGVEDLSNRVWKDLEDIF